MTHAHTETGTLPDALPFYLALEPSPVHERVALAVVRPDKTGGELGVSIIVEDRCVALEVFRFSRLAPVCAAWSHSGSRLAFAQGSTLLVRNEAGVLRPGLLPGDVQWLGFDRNERLWILAGGKLTSDPEVTFVDGVDAAAAHDRVAFGRRERDGTCLYHIDAGVECLLARVPGDHATIKLSSRGDYLVAVLALAATHRQVAAKLVRIHIPSERVDTLLDRTLSCGFNGGPGLDASITDAGEVFAAFEDGASTQLWQIAPGTKPKPITPPGFELFDFELDPAANSVAVIASDTRQTRGASERQLLVGRRTTQGWSFQPPITGVHDMPRWRVDGALETLCGAAGRWRRAAHPSSGQSRSDPTPLPCSVASLSGAAELDLLRLHGSEHRRFGIILLPRLHQQFVAGAQPQFFHHLLFCIARGLAADGYTVVTVSGPGAIGRGRRRRELTGAYLPVLHAALNEIVRFLRVSGCRSFGLLAGSLAAVPGLRLLGSCSELSAAAFVAPLFEASIPVTTPVRDILLDDPLFTTFDAAAADLRVPVQVVHGAHDEVAPLSQVSRLREHAGDPSLVALHLLENEGHIFRSMSSWIDTRSTISSFLAARQAL